MIRVDIRAILSDRVQRRELMIPVIQTIQAREGVETTREQAERAYDAVVSSRGRVLAPHDTVCFASSFARESSPNITHITLDGEKTLCGRRDWMTTEGWRPDLVACANCSRAYEKLGRPHWSDMDASVLETVGS